MGDNYKVIYSDSFEHSGVKGMHWGVRRYQYEDMSLTPEGREHYGVGEPRGKGSSKKSASSKEPKEHKGLSDKQKTALKIGGAVVGTALVAYGGYKLSGVVKNSSLGKKEVARLLESKNSISDALDITKTSVNKIPIKTTEVAKTVVNTTPVNKTVVNTTPVNKTGINLTLNPGISVSMKDVMSSASMMSAASAKSAIDNSGIEDYTMDLLKKVSGMH